jgi:hypothetical protein
MPLAVGAVMQRIRQHETRPSLVARLAAGLRRSPRKSGAKATAKRPPGRARRWSLIPKRLQPRTLPPGVYEAGRAQLHAVWKLAVLLGAAVLLSLLPAVWHGHLSPHVAPGWARSVLMVAGLQGLYVVWMLNAPDWATVRVVMFVFAAVATGYAVATTAVMATPPDHPLPLELGNVRSWAAGWCGGMVLVMGLCTFFSARLSTAWRHTFLQEAAGRSG